MSDPAEGGAFLDAGVHAFDLLRWLADSEATQVFGRALTYIEQPLPYPSGMGPGHVCERRDRQRLDQLRAA